MFKYDVITSLNNPKIIEISKLKNTNYRSNVKKFKVEGIKSCMEALLFAPNKIDSVIYIESFVDYEEKNNKEIYKIIKKTLNYTNKIYPVTETVYKKLTNQHSYQGIMFVINDLDNICKIDNVVETDDIDNNHGTIILDHIQDPGNLGSIIRTAAAFEINTIILSDCVDVYNEKTISSTMGAIYKVHIFLVGELLGAIIKKFSESHRIIASTVSDDDHDLNSFKLQYDDIIILGNEGHGISPDIKEFNKYNVRIPMDSNTESLNVAIAASIFMWEYHKIPKNYKLT